VSDDDRLASSGELKTADLTLADRWILARLSRATQEVNSSFEQYNLHEASRTIYRFFWHEFCDWYLEMIKLHPERSKPVLLFVFESALRLLHPFMPFLTEELWQTIPHRGESIVIAEYPAFDPAFADAEVESQAEMIQDVIVKVRNIRSEMRVDSRQPVVVRMATEDAKVAKLLTGARDYIFRLATVSELEIVPRLKGDKLGAQAVAAGCALEVPLEGLIDLTAEKARLTKELEKVRREMETLERKLSNANFVANAPPDVVEENRRRLKEYQDQAAKFQSALERLT
jgi:valyl-tRNA synthetase